MNSFLNQKIHKTLNSDIAELMPESQENVSIVLAKKRLHAVAEHAPALLTWLAEPWWKNDIAATLIACARIHLYARILDDALDENLPIHRLLLLRAQPFFWSAVGELAILHPQHWQQSTQLIHNTINAVEKDDEKTQPELWGVKNHHLLLIPLFLSNNQESWLSYKQALSDLIWVIQTGDEWKQGELKNKDVKHQILAKIETIITQEAHQQLANGGWHFAAKRLIWECDQLIAVLGK